MLLISLLVNFLLEVQSTGLFGLHEVDKQVPPFEENLCGSLLGGSGRFTVSEAHKGHGGISMQLDVVDVAELSEEVFKLLLGGRRVHVLDDQVHVHHGLLPLVSLLGDLLLPLLL